MRRLFSKGEQRVVELRAIEVKTDLPVAHLDQAAPWITVTSPYGQWRFNQNDTDLVVDDLRRLAGMINRNVAR